VSRWTGATSFSDCVLSGRWCLREADGAGCAQVRGTRDVGLEFQDIKLASQARPAHGSAEHLRVACLR